MRSVQLMIFSFNGTTADQVLTLYKLIDSGLKILRDLAVRSQRIEDAFLIGSALSEGYFLYRPRSVVTAVAAVYTAVCIF